MADGRLIDAVKALSGSLKFSAESPNSDSSITWITYAATVNQKREQQRHLRSQIPEANADDPNHIAGCGAKPGYFVDAFSANNRCFAVFNSGLSSPTATSVSLRK